MSRHQFVGAGFPRQTCSICGQPRGAEAHAPTPEELALERERSAARRRERSEEEFKRIRINDVVRNEVYGYGRDWSKRRGEA